MPLTVDTIARLLERHAKHSDIDYARDYGEPGYSLSHENSNGIVFANWNDLPDYIYKGIKRRGYDLEWSDEWIIDTDYSKAYRTYADSHFWRPSYILLDNGEMITRDSVEDGSDIEEYIEFLVNNPDAADMWNIPWEKYGFQKHSEDYETGYHAGQTDSPKKVFESLKKVAELHKNNSIEILFRIDDSNTFTSTWSVWTRKVENNEYT